MASTAISVMFRLLCFATASSSSRSSKGNLNVQGTRTVRRLLRFNNLVGNTSVRTSVRTPVRPAALSDFPAPSGAAGLALSGSAAGGTSVCTYVCIGDCTAGTAGCISADSASSIGTADGAPCPNGFFANSVVRLPRSGLDIQSPRSSTGLPGPRPWIRAHSPTPSGR